MTRELGKTKRNGHGNGNECVWPCPRCLLILLLLCLFVQRSPVERETALYYIVETLLFSNLMDAWLGVRVRDLVRLGPVLKK